MKKILIILILFCAGCKAVEYRGEIEIYDANGLLVKRVVATTNKAAMMKAGDVEIDSRGSSFFKDLLQLLTLGFFMKE